MTISFRGSQASAARAAVRMLNDFKSQKYRMQSVKWGHEHGWSYVPLDGKVPTEKAWQKRKRETLSQALEWAQSGNVGVRTGSASGGLVVLDLDKGADLNGLPVFPDTVTAITPGGGQHLYFFHDQKLGNSVGKIATKVDVRGDGGQVVAPGSIHPDNGDMYQWAPGRAPWDIEIAPLPTWIVEKLEVEDRREEGKKKAERDKESHYARAAFDWEISSVRSAPEGTRNDTLNKASFSLGQIVAGGELDRIQVEESLMDAALSTALPEREVRATIKSGLEAGMRKPRTASGWKAAMETEPTDSLNIHNLTDAGNAEAFVSLYGNQVRFNHQRGLWFLWNGTIWIPDGDGKINRLALETIRQRYHAAGDDQHIAQDRKMALAKHAIKSESRDKINAMLHIAKSLKPIADSGDGWDADLFFMAVPDGVIDLRTGNLIEPQPDQKISKLCRVKFDPSADAPRFVQFLSEVFQGDHCLIDYIQRAVGYSLTGSTTEQVFFFCFGRGANGKSTLLSIFRYILGDYAGNAAFSTFDAFHKESTSCDIADLDGKRLIVVSEVKERGVFDEQRLKSLTGEKSVRVRHLYGRPFDLLLHGKIWLMGNHRPIVRDDSFAFWRRVRLIPFLKIFDPAKEPDLAKKLEAEAPGILAWAVRGAVDWYKRGLSDVPACVQSATAEYERDQDPLHEWIVSECELGDGIMRAQDGYNSYKTWAEKAGLKERERLSRTRFGRMMGGRFEKTKDMKGAIYHGIRLRSEGES